MASSMPQGATSGMAYPSSAGAAPSPIGAISAATQTIYRQQERLYILVVDLKALLDSAFGPVPDAQGGAQASNGKPTALLHQLDAAQQGMDVVIDDLARQVNRLRAL